MRIRIAVLAVLRVRSCALERFDAAARDNDRRRGRGSFHQPIEPALESQPVDEDDAGVRHLLRVRRGGGIDVRVAVRPDQSRHVHTFAADVFHEVCQDREAGDDLEPAVSDLLRHAGLTAISAAASAVAIRAGQRIASLCGTVRIQMRKLPTSC